MREPSLYNISKIGHEVLHFVLCLVLIIQNAKNFWEGFLFFLFPTLGAALNYEYLTIEAKKICIVYLASFCLRSLFDIIEKTNKKSEGKNNG